MCGHGRLYIYKVSRSKVGLVTKGRLTKHGAGWVDYLQRK